LRADQSASLISGIIVNGDLVNGSQKDLSDGGMIPVAIDAYHPEYSLPKSFYFRGFRFVPRYPGGRITPFDF